MHLVGDNAIGALSYTLHEQPFIRTRVIAREWLESLTKYAKAFDAGITSDNDPESLERFFDAGSSPGGARPKVLVSESDDRHSPGWIAKFSSINDQVDIPKLEYATLEIAKTAGLPVASTELVNTEYGPVLLVRRFDRTETGGRLHLISMQTLLEADHYYHLGYIDLADIVRRYSGQPDIDLKLLFKQAVFNMVIGNTDDHLKNFTMLFGNKGWRLSPCYDLLPHPKLQTGHVLHYGETNNPKTSHLLKLGRDFGLSHQAINKIIKEVVHAAGTSKEIYQNTGLSVHPVMEKIQDNIDQRIEEYSRLSKKATNKLKK